jgi:UDP-N-acetylmuramate dehydrogenase
LASDYNRRAMTTQLCIQYNFPLGRLNTFGIDAKAHAYLHVTSLEMLLELGLDATLSGVPRLVLGGGSNIVLTQDFNGLVLHMGIRGIDIVGEDANATYVRAAAGENWHEFVLWTLDRNMGGLENLSLIPGYVGAAPIQNIGAYGVEAKDCFHSLTGFNFQTGQLFSLSKPDCQFGYRDSIFKHALQNSAVILDVTFALPKQWQPSIRYVDVARGLNERGIAEPTMRDISDTVIAIRSNKLPDPSVIGNAGSFFKNPLVSAAQREALLAAYPELVSYQYSEGMFKLAAGWLIECCGWKGRRTGRVGVYEKQALVLVNHGNAKGDEVVQLARDIQADVLARFGVKLEPEPIFI